jgi:RNA polymerase sigma-70 factor (sigma-E family)
VKDLEERIGRVKETAVVGPQAESKAASLYAACAPDAVRLAFLLTGDRHLAEDLVQEAFVKILGRFGDLRNPDSFQAYLRRTVVNLTKKHWRRQDVERRFRQRAEGAPEVTTEIPDVESRAVLWDRVQKLPHRQRAVLVLRFYEDLSERQAADALGCSPGAVKSLTQRAMESLRRMEPRLER